MFSLIVCASLIGQCGCYTPPPSCGCESSGDYATFSVEVPAEAKVYVNNYLTKSTGTKREYKSFNLSSDYNYTYDVVVQYNGQIKHAQIVLAGGEDKAISFDFPPPVIPAVQKLLPPIPVKLPLKLEPTPALPPIPVVQKPEVKPEVKKLQPIPDLDIDRPFPNYDK